MSTIPFDDYAMAICGPTIDVDAVHPIGWNKYEINFELVLFINKYKDTLDLDKIQLITQKFSHNMLIDKYGEAACCDSRITNVTEANKVNDSGLKNNRYIIFDYTVLQFIAS
jgi:hypothetical protein